MTFADHMAIMKALEEMVHALYYLQGEKGAVFDAMDKIRKIVEGT